MKGGVCVCVCAGGGGGFRDGEKNKTWYMAQLTFPSNVYLGIYIPICIWERNFAWRPLITNYNHL